jgi:hypothetical protein
MRIKNLAKLKTINNCSKTNLHSLGITAEKLEKIEKTDK